MRSKNASRSVVILTTDMEFGDFKRKHQTFEKECIRLKILLSLRKVIFFLKEEMFKFSNIGP